MAERRMLWKLICQSRKVNRLSDKACILYTFSLSWTDRDGFIEAEADYLKTNVVPRRKNISEEEIPELINEIVREKLWDLFILNDGQKVAYVRKHKELQKDMKYDRERESVFINKIKGLKPIQIDELPDLSRTTPVQNTERSPYNKRKENKIKEQEQGGLPEDSRTKIEINEEQKLLFYKIEKYWKDVWRFIQRSINNDCFIEDIVETLKSFDWNHTAIDEPWAWCTAVIDSKTKRRRETLREDQWNKLKEEEKSFSVEIAKLLKGIGKPV